MARFVELAQEHGSVWVNPDHVVAVFADAISGGSRVETVTDLHAVCGEPVDVVASLGSFVVDLTDGARSRVLENLWR